MKKHIENLKESLGVFYAEKQRKDDLFHDKRVKEIVECDFCHAPISKNKYNKNGGYCDNCIEALY
jgi:hypothetical protein